MREFYRAGRRCWMRPERGFAPIAKRLVARKERFVGPAPLRTRPSYHGAACVVESSHADSDSPSVPSPLAAGFAGPFVASRDGAWPCSALVAVPAIGQVFANTILPGQGLSAAPVAFVKNLHPPVPFSRRSGAR